MGKSNNMNKGLNMMNATRKMHIAEAMLLLTAMIWGSGFVVMKNALDIMPVHFLLGMRFIIAALFMFAFLHRRMIKQTKADILRGCILGAVMYAAYAVQTYGLMYTTAGQNAFLTAVYVVLVPLMVCVYKRLKPTLLQMAAALLCLVGIGVLAIKSNFSMGIGDALSLLCGVLYALHIVLVDRFAKKTDALILTSMQFSVSGVLGLCCFFLFEKAPVLKGDALFALLYLAIVGTLLALTMQNIGIRYADPSHASLIMGMESLFGTVFGCIFLNEPVTIRMFFGSTLILCSIILSEIRITKHNKKQEKVNKDMAIGQV